MNQTSLHGHLKPKVKKLLEHYQKISLLTKIKDTLDWDMNVNLPPKATQGRANQIGFLTELISDYWLDREFRLLVDQIQNSSNLNNLEKAIIRNINHQGKLYFKVPKELIVEKATTSTEAFMIWQQAKQNNNFADFLPYLKKLVHINRLIADHLGYQKNPYDALLDLFEPQLTADFCQQIFDELQPQLTKLLNKIVKSSNYQPDDELLSDRFTYPQQDQKQLAVFVLKKMGYDFEAGRIDVSAHPFETTLDRYDVRITTWYHHNDFRASLMAAMHEGGHALYEQNVNPEYSETPLQGGVSHSIHESQSRFWENQIGRNPAFLEFITPLLQAFYPEQLGKVNTERIVKLFNLVKPSLIRVEADEVTYNLHIILRFELENLLINEKIKVEELPEIWREKMKQYLGVEPETDREGVLQDVHWSLGYFGYFPTYCLGNLYSAQFAAYLKKEIDLTESLIKGELGNALYWLKDQIHQYGSLYWPRELATKVTKEELNPQYFLAYLQEKYSKLYDFS